VFTSDDSPDTTTYVRSFPRTLKPDRQPGNAVCTAASISSSVKTPSSTSSSNSFILMFHSCSRPRNSPASSTQTECPLSRSARAKKTPSVPPQITTSKSRGCSRACSSFSQQAGLPMATSCVTNWGGGGMFFFLLLDGSYVKGRKALSRAQLASTRWKASHVLTPPAPVACVSWAVRFMMRSVMLMAAVLPLFSVLVESAARLPFLSTRSAPSTGFFREIRRDRRVSAIKSFTLFLLAVAVRDCGGGCCCGGCGSRGHGFGCRRSMSCCCTAAAPAEPLTCSSTSGEEDDDLSPSERSEPDG